MSMYSTFTHKDGHTEFSGGGGGGGGGGSLLSYVLAPSIHLNNSVLPCTRILLIPYHHPIDACRTAFYAQPSIQAALACPPEEACCFAELTVDSTETAEFRFATASWMRNCLRNVFVTSNQAQSTSMIIKNILRESYAFSDLVRDTHDTDAVIEGQYSGVFQVHHIQTRIADEVESVLASTQLPDGSHPAYDFHYGMADIFRRLNDAHTHYDTPFFQWSLLRVATLWPQSNSDGQQVFVLKSKITPPDSEYYFVGEVVEHIYSDVHSIDMPNVADYEGRVVTHVNGIPAAAYMQQRADMMGGIKSPGGRLNALLNTESASNSEPMDTTPPPDMEEEVFTFEDGTSVSWKITVRFDGNATVSPRTEIAGPS